MSRSAKLLLTSQLLLFAAIAVCTILMPQFFWSTDQGGMSNYGLHSRTLVPFLIGFGGCALFTCAAAVTLPKTMPHLRAVQASLWLIGLFGLVLAITTFTYKLSPLLNTFHVRGAQILAAVEGFVGTWYALWLVKNHLNYIGYAILCVGLVLGILTVIGSVHLLFTAEFLASLGFGIVAVHTIHILTRS